MLVLVMLLPPTGHAYLRYEIEFNEALNGGKVKLEVKSAGLVAPDRVRVAQLHDVTDCAGQTVPGAELRRTLGVGLVCVRYGFKIPELPAGRFQIQLPQNVAVFDPNRILFLRDGESAKVALLGGVPVSHPWREEQGEYWVDASPRSSTAQIVLGAFHKVEVAGLNKPAAFVGAKLHVPKLSIWLADLVAETGAGYPFPNPNLQIMMFGVPQKGPSPVPFGHVIRNQGESVRLFVDADASLKELRYDWTVAHELAHLKLPYVSGRGRWISEGFASYYQNVLQARAGYYSEAEAWQRLIASFERAAEVGRDMSPNDAAARPFWQARLMIYWSGAALALMADSKLRQLGTSLDAALATLTLPSRRSWTPGQLFALLDQNTGLDVFTPLYREHGDRLGMPDTGAVLKALGVVKTGDSVLLLDSAELSGIRQKIMAPTVFRLAQ